MGLCERLETRHFRLGRRPVRARVELTQAELNLLLGGLDLSRTRKRRWIRLKKTAEKEDFFSCTYPSIGYVTIIYRDRPVPTVNVEELQAENKRLALRVKATGEGTLWKPRRPP